MNQVTEYIEKINKLLRETPNYVPYPLNCYYTLLKTATIQVKEKDVSLQLVGNYANIYKKLKEWLQKPIPDPKERERIFPDLKKFLIPFRKYLPRDQISRAFLRNFQDDQNHHRVRQLREKADQISKQYEQKNNIVHIASNSDVVVGFWVKQFKADYAVHFSVFWNGLMQFIKEFSYYQKFVSDSSRKTIKELMDPQGKFIVGMAAANDLFHSLMEPSFLRLLAEQTASGFKEPQFKSYRRMKLKFHSKEQITTKLTNDNILLISGEQVTVNGEITKCKYPQTVRFGSSQDTEIMIKHKFISRRQFMLIQQQLGFSIICISPSNYTTVVYLKPVQLFPGQLLKVGNDIVQIVKIGVKFQNILDNINRSQSYSLTEYQNTLQYLPQNESIHGVKQLEYKILNGPKKDERGVIESPNNIIATSSGEIQLLFEYNTFYLPANTPLLLKTANQVLTGHLSDKCFLEPGMKIELQECSFTVIE